MESVQLTLWKITVWVATILLLPLSQSAPIKENKLPTSWHDAIVTTTWRPEISLNDQTYNPIDNRLTLSNMRQLEDFGWEMTSAKPFPKHIGRIVKKESFVPRNWSAGGLPFSALYLNRHGTRQNNARTDLTRPKATSTSRSIDTNSEQPLSIRSRVSEQSRRRQYSIIPHLLLSYGWGRFGK